ncbi:hypothetical protein ACIP5N_32895 [Streptomyces sp. NPDC088768]|uniref:hypothetical protein n=1 Tax=Streptomyces sp. NPDC088768 TaxID=3365894 RepID=UPI0037F98617
MQRQAALAVRLRTRGKEYQRVLDIGQAAVARALRTARRALPEGAERTAVRHALDDLMNRHVLPDDAERLAHEQLDREVESTHSPATTAWCKHAVSQYVSPVRGAAM